MTIENIITSSRGTFANCSWFEGVTARGHQYRVEALALIIHENAADRIFGVLFVWFGGVGLFGRRRERRGGADGLGVGAQAVSGGCGCVAGLSRRGRVLRGPGRWGSAGVGDGEQCFGAGVPFGQAQKDAPCAVAHQGGQVP